MEYNRCTTMKPRPRVSARTRLAYHEAGHAVLSAAIGNPPDYVSIRATGHALGHNLLQPSQHASSRIQVHLAGYAAEHILTGRRPTQFRQEIVFSALAQFFDGVREALETVEHSEDRDGYRAVEDICRLAVFEDEKAICKEVERYYAITVDSLTCVWRSVEAVAKGLLKHEALERPRLDEAIWKVDIYALLRPLQHKQGFLQPKHEQAPADA